MKRRFNIFLEEKKNEFILKGDILFGSNFSTKMNLHIPFKKNGELNEEFDDQFLSFFEEELIFTTVKNIIQLLNSPFGKLKFTDLNFIDGKTSFGYDCKIEEYNLTFSITSWSGKAFVSAVCENTSLRLDENIENTFLPFVINYLAKNSKYRTRLLYHEVFQNIKEKFSV